MTPFRHKGCTSPAITYTGAEPLQSKPPMRRTDWKLPDGSHPEPGLMLITCPDCGKTIPVSPTALEELPQNPLHSAENR